MDNELERLVNQIVIENKGVTVCLCGHFQDKHNFKSDNNIYCNDCLLSLWIPHDSICKGYKQDNLKFLEAKNDQTDSN